MTKKAKKKSIRAKASVQGAPAKQAPARKAPEKAVPAKTQSQPLLAETRAQLAAAASPMGEISASAVSPHPMGSTSDQAWNGTVGQLLLPASWRDIS